MSDAIIWLQFALCLLVIGVAGVKLSEYGDAIADKTGLGGTWIGLALIASVTSLPELITGISSVTVAGVPDIAIGDVLGSCVFNLLIIVVLDFMYRRESVYSRASHGHVIGAGFGIMLIGMVGFSLLWSSLGSPPALGHIGLYTPVIVLLYAVALRTILVYEKRSVVSYVESEPDRLPQLTLGQVVARYVAAAAFVVIAGAWLPFIGEALAEAMGWHQSFVGTLFVAFVTSVPELVVTVAALKFGALDMAIGNLLGSNIFNILILGLDDVFFVTGPLLESVSTTHAVSAFSAMVMSGVAVVALLYRPTQRVLKSVSWASLVIAATYLLNSFVLFVHG